MSEAKHPVLSAQPKYRREMDGYYCIRVSLFSCVQLTLLKTYEIGVVFQLMFHLSTQNQIIIFLLNSRQTSVSVKI